MGMAPVNMKVFLNVLIIVVGVVIASFGEIRFILIGVLYQVGGLTFEATRLVMVQRLLSSAEYKMDPLVSLYYFAPICAVMNGVTALFLEVPHVTMDQVYATGIGILLINAMIAFMLNVSVVFLVGFFFFFFFFFTVQSPQVLRTHKLTCPRLAKRRLLS